MRGNQRANAPPTLADVGSWHSFVRFFRDDQQLPGGLQIALISGLVEGQQQCIRQAAGIMWFRISRATHSVCRSSKWILLHNRSVKVCRVL